MTEMDRFLFSVPGLTLPSRCPCCIGGAKNTQSLVAPTLELKSQSNNSFVNVLQYKLLPNYHANT